MVSSQVLFGHRGDAAVGTYAYCSACSVARNRRTDTLSSICTAASVLSLSIRFRRLGRSSRLQLCGHPIARSRSTCRVTVCRRYHDSSDVRRSPTATGSPKAGAGRFGGVEHSVRCDCRAHGRAFFDDEPVSGDIMEFCTRRYDRYGRGSCVPLSRGLMHAVTAEETIPVSTNDGQNGRRTAESCSKSTENGVSLAHCVTVSWTAERSDGIRNATHPPLTLPGCSGRP